MTHQTHAEMVDSGIEWIGKIPKGWEVRKLKYGSDLINGYSFDSNTYVDDGFPIVRISDVGQEINFDDVKRVPYDMAYSISKFKVINGDILVAMTGATIGKSSLFNYDQDCYLNQRVGIIRAKNLLDQKYLYYFVGSNIFRENIDLACAGGAQENIGKPELGKIILSLPSLETQQAIATYLDTKTAQIDQAIALKTQQIELLREKRSALINHVVTKGLDPDVELVDSGIERIGKIPKGWEVRKLKHLFNIKAGGDLNVDSFSEDLTEEHKYPIFTNAIDPDTVYGYTNKPNYRSNTITVTGRGDVGFAIYRDCDYDAIIRLLVLTPFVDSNPKYFTYQINNVLNFTVGTTTITQLSASQISPYRAIYPPIDIQNQIVSQLDTKIAEIDQTISLIQQSIDLLVEYKQSLISHVVTGKVKVG